MPEPKLPKRVPKETKPAKPVPVVQGEIIEPRCHVCQSKYRTAIDRLIAVGTSYSEIARLFGGEIDRRSISNHAKEHLQYEHEAVRSIMEQRARDAQENLEEGVSTRVMRRAVLDTAVMRVHEALSAGDAVVELKDAVKIIELAEKLEAQDHEIMEAEIEKQYNAFVTAMQEILDEETYFKVVDRTKEIYGRTINEPKQIEAGE